MKMEEFYFKKKKKLKMRKNVLSSENKPFMCPVNRIRDIHKIIGVRWDFAGLNQG